MSPKNKPGFFGRIINAFLYSLKGLAAVFKNEAAFRQELLLIIPLVPVALLLEKTGLGRALMISSLFLILILELINSAVEAVVDRFGSEWHELAGRAKDMGSAAVLLGFVNAVVVWIFVLT
jgi:diacylglycerol kinase (ATP)